MWESVSISQPRLISHECNSCTNNQLQIKVSGFLHKQELTQEPTLE